MKMIDTALESLDVLFFDDKILGTTGVPYILFKNSIEWISFSGTMRTSMVPKIIRQGK